MSAPEPYPDIGQLKRHLDVSIWADFTCLNEAFTILTVHNEVEVNVIQELIGYLKAGLNHILTLKNTKVLT